VVADHPPARPGSLAEARDLGLAAQRQAQITRAAVAVLLVGGVLLAVLLGLLFRRRRRRPTQG
jgi:LPXTG-motif cell wall-anchored protein